MSADELDAGASELIEHLGHPAPLSATHSAPFYYWVHDPSRTLELQRRLPRFGARLEAAGWCPRIVSLSTLAWSVIDASGRFEDWLEVESRTSPDALRGSVKEVLRDRKSIGAMGEVHHGLAAALAPYVSDATPNRILILTDAALLHPWFRVRTLESVLHDQVRCPTVVLYPGRRLGLSGLQFLGCYAEDANYRSTVVGGLPS